MVILTLRTDKPEAELGLYNNDQQLNDVTWQAHRQLAETVHLKIKALLESQNMQLSDIQAIVLYKGPGSFTGLRIGASVANALAASLAAPIVGESGADWIKAGVSRLQNHDNDQIVTPDYGAPVRITLPKK